LRTPSSATPPGPSEAAEEPVHTIREFFDHPLVGFADCNGAPYLFHRVLEKGADEYSDLYHLWPVSREVVAAEIELEILGQRWLAAFQRQEVSLDQPRTLPEDRERYDALMAVVGPVLEPPGEPALVRLAKFRVSIPFGSSVIWSEPLESGV
jgi:hypothetical protein